MKRIFLSSLVNKFKSKIIFENFSIKLRNLLNISKKAKKKLLTKAFSRYRNIVYLRGKMMKLKHEVENNIEKRKEKEIAIIETKIKDKEKEVLDSKKQIEINSEHINDLSKKVKQFEENFSIFTQNYKKIEVSFH
jgi:hypothetical protein